MKYVLFYHETQLLSATYLTLEQNKKGFICHCSDGLVTYHCIRVVRVGQPPYRLVEMKVLEEQRHHAVDKDESLENYENQL